MSWKIAIAVALLTAVITALVTAPVADKVTRMIGVPDREGGRGMLVAFILIPAGFIGGFLFGILGARLAHALEWAQFWRATGFSLALGLGALAAIAGVALLSVVRPPLLDRHSLALRIEVRVPARLLPAGPLDKGALRMSLFAGEQDNHYADIDTAHVRMQDDSLVVPGEARLYSKATFRMVGFHFDGTDGWALDPLPLPPVPTEKDLEWTAPMRMREARVNGTRYTFTDVMLRYRVVKKEPVP